MPPSHSRDSYNSNFVGSCQNIWPQAHPIATSLPCCLNSIPRWNVLLVCHQRLKNPSNMIHLMSYIIDASHILSYQTISVKWSVVLRRSKSWTSQRSPHGWSSRGSDRCLPQKRHKLSKLSAEIFRQGETPVQPKARRAIKEWKSLSVG